MMDWETIKNDPATLRDLYSRMSPEEMRTQFGWIYPCACTIREYLRQHGIPLRGKGGFHSTRRAQRSAKLAVARKLDTANMTAEEIREHLGHATDWATRRFLNYHGLPYRRKQSCSLTREEFLKRIEGVDTGRMNIREIAALFPEASTKAIFQHCRRAGVDFIRLRRWGQL